MAYNYLFLYDVFKVHKYLAFTKHSGDEGIRTPDPLLARQVLSQLSYTPMGAFIIHTDLLPNYKQQKMG